MQYQPGYTAPPPQNVRKETIIDIGLMPGKLYPHQPALGASRLMAIALAHALSLFAAVASSLNVSSGHINPAVTFSALVGGRVSVLREVYYWVAQLLGDVVASGLLRLATDGLLESAEPRKFNSIFLRVVGILWQSILVPWKLLFAFVPPYQVAHGWIAFICSLIFASGIAYGKFE